MSTRSDPNALSESDWELEPSSGTAQRDIIAYLGLVLIATVAVSIARPHSAVAPTVAAFVPVGTLLLLTAYRGTSVWRGLGLNRTGARYWPIAVGIPALAAGAVYSVVLWLGLVKGPQDVSLSTVATVAFSALISTFAVLGEELGWRGFLLPRMQLLTSKPLAALWTGLAHAIVHLPLVLLTTTYNQFGNRWMVATLTVVTITAAGICYGWLRDASHSLWPVALAHGVANTLMLVVATAALPNQQEQLAGIAGEGGIATAGVLVLAALLTTVIARRGAWRPES